MIRVKQFKQYLEIMKRKWSGRADLAGKCSWKGHNKKDTSYPEAIRLYSDGFTAGPAASPTRRRDKELLLIRRNVTLLLQSVGVNRSSAISYRQ
jgi:hypothetical protein